MATTKQPDPYLSEWFADGQALNDAQKTSSRRDFLIKATTLTAVSGFALAAQPVQAQQIITTDTQGLNARALTIDAKGTQLPIFVAQPENAQAKLPLVIVVSEIFGVHEHIADVARRFAKQGYMAIAPDFFKRAGDPSKIETVAEIFKQIISRTPDAQVLDDIRATLSWAQNNGADMQKAGITGFCWGGRITWLACAAIDQFKAGVAWYGRLVGEVNENFPKNPVDIAADLKAPVLGLYGGKDTGIPLETVETMQAALKKAAASNPAAAASRFEIFPEAPHAFHADYRPSYREEAARQGWKLCLEWFKQHGV